MSHGPTSTETRHLRTLFAVGAAGMLTDGQLLERFATRDGDPAELAFAALVERHGSMVLRVARGVAIDEHSAHDVFQATFLILARKARSLWVRDSLGPWLHGVAYRVASQARSTEIRRKRRENVAARSELVHPHDRDRADLIRAIHEEIDRLPQPFRLAIVTCHLEGLTQQDAAARLGWPVGTLQSRLARGRQKLRDRLERRGLDPSLAVIAHQYLPVPHALMNTTAKAAASLHLGKGVAALLAPTALALIETSTKGMLMTKLKIGVTAVVLMVGGVAGTGMTVGLGRAVQATDENRAIAGIAAPSASNRELALAIPPAADVPGVPHLLEFYSSESAAGRENHRGIASLIDRGYPIKSYDRADYWSGGAPGRDLDERYRIDIYPTILLVDGSGREISRLPSLQTPAMVAAFYNENRSRSAPPEPAVLAPVPEQEPALTPSHGNPKPWETVVRIKLALSETEWGFGSGTVISSTPEESIILTCAHTFRLKGKPQPVPGDFNIPIKVDLFNGQLVGKSPAQVGRGPQDILGALIDYDFDNNVALLRIRPGYILPASRVVPAGWQPKKGMKMYAVGCSHGADATAWDTTILDPRVTMNNTETKQLFSEIKCTNQPKEGRSGGGLYTTDGYVAGVCNFADPNEHVGLYAVADAIHRLLDRNGLKAVYERTDEVATSVPTKDVDIHGFKYPAPAEMLAAAGHHPASPTVVVPPSPVQPQQAAPEPSLDDHAAPKPWETVVRVNILKNQPEALVASGVVIRSWPTSAYVLTSAHALRATGIMVRDSRLLAKPQVSNISVDLFDGRLVGRSPGKVGCIERDLPAEVVCCDFALDLAVLKVTTRFLLPVSPLADLSWKPREGVELISVGCSDGNDATAWNTRLIDPNVPLTAKDGTTVVMKCEHFPRPGRSGGGLFTLDGSLAGLGTYTDPAAHSGFYAPIPVIRKFLYDQGLRELSGPDDPDPSQPKRLTANSFAESKLFQRNAGDQQAGPAPPMTGGLPPQPSGNPDGIIRTGVKTDDQRRIDELEKKLDQVLKALEGLKGGKSPE